MKKIPTLFLQAVIVFLGLGVLTFLLWEPHLEGVNAHAAFFEVYLDPFIAYMYLGSIPFFVGLYQAFKLLGYIRHDAVFSEASVKALRTIRYCAFITAGAIVAADAYLAIAARSGTDDPAGAVMLGLIATGISLVVGTVALVFERIVRKA
jgi:hypothetical protein